MNCWYLIFSIGNILVVFIVLFVCFKFFNWLDIFFKLSFFRLRLLECIIWVVNCNLLLLLEIIVFLIVVNLLGVKLR